MLPTIHLFRVSGDDRLAIVSVEPAGPGAWMLRVARGKVRGKLTGGTVYGPYLAASLRPLYEELLAKLEAEGFVRAGRQDTLLALTSSRAAERARAALRLGWRRDRDAVGPLIAALAVAKRDAPAIVDALGMIGDTSALEAVRPFAERQLLSRRRSGVEALRNLGDVEGLAQARQRGLERLPTTVVAALGQLDEHDVRKENLQPLLDALKALDTKERALSADVLYEADTPVAVAAAKRALQSIPLEKPHAWRYAKSVYKRAMLRHDAAMVGWLSHAIEQRARVSTGTKAVLKSGLDGESREMPVFSKKTQGYVRRLGWRYLTRLARWRPDRYADVAAEVLVHYGPEDLRAPKGRLGRFAECYLLARILFGGGTRYAFDSRRLRARYASAAAAKEPPSHVREEAHPELWDARPRAYLRIASAARLPEVLDFAARGLARHPDAVKDAGSKVLLGLLGAGHAGLVAVGLAELERRFEPHKPDVALLRRLLSSEHEPARVAGTRLARECAAWWAVRGRALVELLLAAPGAQGAELASAAAAVLSERDAAVRMGVAEKVLAALRAPEPSEGAHAPLAELARLALLADLDAMLDTKDVIDLVDASSTPVRALAGALLARRPEAFALVGLERLRAWCESELVGVRRAGHALLRGGESALREDPAPLFALAESRWDDTRAAALGVLRDAVGFERLGLEGVIALCDASPPDVRALGRELVVRGFDDALDPQEVLFKLVEHPARDMRRFALTLIEAHLKPGFVPLARIDGFVKAVLLDLSPDREVKRRLIRFLEARGLSDERQAEVVIALLDAVVRTKTIHDFERVIGALTNVHLAFPAIRSIVRLNEETAS
jgi:hypothetical protein